ncbi:N-formylglutamate amidohydrolase [Myxosarcina sp. GI1(2024)]
MSQLWVLREGHQPFVAVALHDGHYVRSEVEQLLAISKDNRKREEDPFTAAWTDIAETRLIVLRSRFELDLNRPRNRAIYLKPEDAWGMQIWKEMPSEAIIERSLAEYDAFYAAVGRICKSLEQRYGRFVIYDLHTYNHYRQGRHAPPADESYNPEINLGTGSLHREYWQPVVERFIEDMRQFDFLGRQLDVRENIKFMGGHFAEWVHQHFPRSGCVLAIEVKKFFMSEWTHQPDLVKMEAVHQALRSTVPGILEELQYLEKNRLEVFG